MTDVNESIRWQLEGIQAERQKLQARLEYITQRERELQSQGLTGATTPRTARSGKKGGTTKGRKLSPEHREKMSKAAKDRWAQRKAAQQKSAGAAPVADSYAPPLDTAIPQTTA